MTAWYGSTNLREPPGHGYNPFDFVGDWDAAHYVIEVVDLSLSRTAAVPARVFGALPFTSLEYGRIANDISTARVTVSGSEDFQGWLEEPLRPWRHNLRIVRSGAVVWAGPVVSVGRAGGDITVDAFDFTVWGTRRLLPADIRFDNSPIPNIGIPGEWLNTYQLLAVAAEGVGPTVISGSLENAPFVISRRKIFSYASRTAREYPDNGGLIPPHAFESDYFVGEPGDLIVPDQGASYFASSFSLSVPSLRSIRDHFDDLNDGVSMDVRWTAYGDRWISFDYSNQILGPYSDENPFRGDARINPATLNRADGWDGSEMRNEEYWPAIGPDGDVLDDQVGYLPLYDTGDFADFPNYSTFSPYGADGIIARNIGSPPDDSVDPDTSRSPAPRLSLELTPGDPIGPNDLLPHRTVSVVPASRSNIVDRFGSPSSWVEYDDILMTIDSCAIRVETDENGQHETATVELTERKEAP